MDANGQAAAIYDPQQAAETTALATQRDNTVANLEQSKASINPYYDAALLKLGKLAASQTDNSNLLYSSRLDGNFSGLQANANRLIGQNYMDNAKSVELDRANKLTGINLQENQAKSGYDSGVSALASKYTGLKSQYVIGQQQAADQRAYQTQQAALDRASQAAAYSNNNSSGKATLDQLFSGYDPSKDTWYTEKTVIPQLMSDYGYTKDQAAKAAYDYRKAKFNE